MNLKTGVSAAALSFAHLTGLARPAAGKTKGDDDEDMKQREGESDEDYAARKKEADRKKAAASKDDEEDDDDGVEDDDKEKMGDDAPTIAAKRRARAAARKAFAKGLSAERERCAAIFASEHATGRIAVACQLAFGTTLSAPEAVAVLQATPAQAAVPTRRDERLDANRPDARNPDLGPQGGAEIKGDAAIAASWDRALAKYIPAR